MRPVLVGIDPGGSGAEPLSPSYPPGARLVGLSGMEGKAFLASFDRVNLHPTTTDQGHDRRAADNLMPILRGRRVVALGRRVGAALDADDGRELEWSLRPGGYVGATLPHPSGMNRWWKSMPNVEDGVDFLYWLQRPCIHVEGPDGSGKSTLVEHLASRFNLKLIGTQNPPKTWSECLTRVHDRINPGIACDRSSGLISELVYGPVIRGKCVTREEDLWAVVRAVVHAVTFVYCRTQWSNLAPNHREGEDPEHTRSVDDKLWALAARYDEVMARVTRLGGKVVTYDFTKDDVEGVAACVA